MIRSGKIFVNGLAIPENIAEDANGEDNNNDGKDDHKAK
jgi:hypothetical protein